MKEKVKEVITSLTDCSIATIDYLVATIIAMLPGKDVMLLSRMCEDALKVAILRDIIAMAESRKSEENKEFEEDK